MLCPDVECRLGVLVLAPLSRSLGSIERLVWFSYPRLKHICNVSVLSTLSMVSARGGKKSLTP